MKAYEIYSESHSCIVHAETLQDAVKMFLTHEPDEVVIFAEDVKKRALDNALNPEAIVDWEALWDDFEDWVDETQQNEKTALFKYENRADGTHDWQIVFSWFKSKLPPPTLVRR